MFKSAESFSTTLSSGITPASNSMTLPSSAIAFLTTLGIDGTNYTEAALTDGVSFEIVRLTEVLGGTAVGITRGQAGTAAGTFPSGTTVRFVWTANGVQEEAAIVGASVSFTSNVAGAITGGPAVFNIDFPVYTAGANLVLSGTYPNYSLALDPGYTPPSGGSVASVSGSTDFNVSDPTSNPIISLSNIFPTTGGGNVFGAGLSVSGAISGIRVSNTGRVMEVAATALPNGVFSNAVITIANGIISAISEGVAPGAPETPGSVTIVNAGTGITVSGVPSENPTVGISNTGVTAGVYEGLQINAQGQIVAVPGGFAPISNITSSSPGIVIASGGTGIKTITIASGTDLTPGLVEYADNGEAVSMVATDKAISPAGLKVALNSLGKFTKQVVTAGSISGVALTNIVQAINTIGIADYVYVDATVVFTDPTAGASAYDQTFGIGIYVNGVVAASIPAYPSGQKSISVVIPSFAGGSIDVRCTTPTGSQTASGIINAIAFSDVP